ncbi:MAG: mechanosensitive ion channel family protein, partial [Spirulinaceae cyanobacterium]
MAQFFSFFQGIFDWLQTNGLFNALIFLGLFLVILVVGRYTPALVRLAIYRLAPEQSQVFHRRWIEPVEAEIRFAGTVLLVGWTMGWLVKYQGIYEFLKPLADFALVASLAWLASRLFHIFVQLYGISFVQKVGLEPDELVLPLEAIANLLIGLLAVITFAQSQDINL